MPGADLAVFRHDSGDLQRLLELPRPALDVTLVEVTRLSEDLEVEDLPFVEVGLTCVSFPFYHPV
jgi:hypothetical protein